MGGRTDERPLDQRALGGNRRWRIRDSKPYQEEQINENCASDNKAQSVPPARGRGIGDLHGVIVLFIFMHSHVIIFGESDLCYWQFDYNMLDLKINRK